MTLRYFVHTKGGNDERREVSEAGSMVLFMQQQQCGEFFVNGYAGIKIKYDINTGDVSPVSVEEREWIVYVFSTSAFQSMITPVKEAISLLAKFNVLLELEKYDAEVGGIKKMFQERHLNEKGEFINVTLPAVEDSLRRVVRLAAPGNDSLFGLGNLFLKPAMPSAQSPVRQAIYDALSDGKFYDINSLKEVETILNNIKQAEGGDCAKKHHGTR